MANEKQKRKSNSATKQPKKLQKYLDCEPSETSEEKREEEVEPKPPVPESLGTIHAPCSGEQTVKGEKYPIDCNITIDDGTPPNSARQQTVEPSAEAEHNVEGAEQPQICEQCKQKDAEIQLLQSKSEEVQAVKKHYEEVSAKTLGCVGYLAKVLCVRHSSTVDVDAITITRVKEQGASASSGKHNAEVAEKRLRCEQCAQKDREIQCLQDDSAQAKAIEQLHANLRKTSLTLLTLAGLPPPSEEAEEQAGSHQVPHGEHKNTPEDSSNCHHQDGHEGAPKDTPENSSNGHHQNEHQGEQKDSPEDSSNDQNQDGEQCEHKDTPEDSSNDQNQDGHQGGQKDTPEDSSNDQNQDGQQGEHKDTPPEDSSKGHHQDGQQCEQKDTPEDSSTGRHQHMDIDVDQLDLKITRA